MSGGLFAAGLTILTFTQIGLDTSLWSIRILMFLRGLCMGFAFVPMQAASYATISTADTGRASSIFSTQRQIGISLGVAILASILSSHMQLDRDLGAGADPATVERALDGFHLAFGVAVLFAFMAGFAALFVSDKEAEGTMRARRPVRVVRQATRRSPAVGRRRALSLLRRRRAGRRQPRRPPPSPWTWSHWVVSPGGHLAGADALQRGERAALVGHDPHVDHRRRRRTSAGPPDSCRRRWSARPPAAPPDRW